MPVMTTTRPVTVAQRLHARLTRAAGVAGVVRQVLGVPDYERYLGDALARDPDARPLSRDEFVAARLRARYDTPGSRCC
jgi:uncharacterized short protein YbdD (DUF466 family)